MYASKYDLALIEAARGGDRQAIVTLLAVAQPDIRRYARRSCNAADDVDDGSLGGLSSIAGWLVAVVRRECLRIGARVMGKPVNLDEALLDAANEDRLTHLPQDELRLDLSRAIQSLPENYREVVLLRDIEEMTVDEIGATLNLTRESVKGRLRRARALLREYLLN